jgi:hypothetical protein
MAARTLVVAPAIVLAVFAACATNPAGPGGAGKAAAYPRAPGSPGAPDADIPPRPADADADVAYYHERAAALATEVGVEIARTDFVRMRRGRLYLRSGAHGAGGNLGPLQMALGKAFEAGDDQAIMNVTAKILVEDQADIRAHMMRAIALRRTQREKEAGFHREAAIGLIESIVRGGDGRSFDTAWTVFRVQEEYELLKTRGYLVESQSLQEHGGRSFDVLRARKPEGGPIFTAYFDITELFAEEGRGLSGL